MLLDVAAAEADDEEDGVGVEVGDVVGGGIGGIGSCIVNHGFGG